jgi:hypothetical protein
MVTRNLLLVSILFLSLPGCATLQRHPTLAAIGAAILAGSIAAIAEHHHDQQHQRPPFNPLCAPNCPLM